AVPAAAWSRSTARRPALLPPPVRRRADPRGVRRPAPAQGRARGPAGRPADRRARDDAAGPHLALAPERGTAMSRRAATRVGRADVAVSLALGATGLALTIA